MTLTFNNINTPEKPQIEITNEDGILQGTIIDSCCSTIVSFVGIKQYITIQKGGGQGGFLPTHYLELKEIFLRVFGSAKIKAYLQRQPINIKREFLLAGSALTILDTYEI